MFEHRYGIKLKKTTADATALKLLRQCFPTQSFSELRAKIQANDYVFLSDMEKYQHDGVRQMAKLLREFDKASIETELFEESRYTINLSGYSFAKMSVFVAAERSASRTTISECVFASSQRAFPKLSLVAILTLSAIYNHSFQ